MGALAIVLPPLPGIHLAPCTRTRAHRGGSLACSSVPDLHQRGFCRMVLRLGFSQRRVSCSLSAFSLGFNDVDPELRFLDDETRAHTFTGICTYIWESCSFR